MPPKVSINMPVYNGAETIRLQLDSMLGQTFKDWRLLITDNASDDGTEQICRQYAKRDGRIIYHRNHRNMGLFYSWKRGFYNSTDSLYTIYASSNDYWAPEYLEKCVAALEADPEAVVAYSHYRIVDPKGDLSEPMKDDFSLAGPSREERFITVVSQMGLCTCYYGLMRVLAMVEVEQIFNMHSAAGDNVNLAALSLAGKIIQIPEVLFFRGRPAIDDNLTGRFERLHKMAGGSKYCNSPVVLNFIEFIYANGQAAAWMCGVRDPASYDKLFAMAIPLLISRYGDFMNAELQKFVETVKAGRIHAITQAEGEDITPIGRYRTVDAAMITSCLNNLNRARLFFPNFPELNYARALLNVMLGRHRDALAALEEELEKNPTHLESLDLQAKLRQKLGK